MADRGEKRTVSYPVGVGSAVVASLVFQTILLLRGLPLSGDEGNYALNALCISQGRFDKVDGTWSPGFSAISALPLMAGAGPERAVRLVNLFALLGLILATAWLTRALFGSGAAVLSAWMIATTPLAQSLGAGGLSDLSGCLFITIAAALTASRAERAHSGRGTFSFALAGVLFVLAVLVRSELAYAAVPGLLFALATPGRRKAQTGAFLAGLILSFALVVGAKSAVGWPVGYAYKGAMNLSFASRGLMDAPDEAERVVYGLTEAGERAVDLPGRVLSSHDFLPLMRRALHQWPDVVANLLRGCASPAPILLAPFGFFFLSMRRFNRASLWGLALLVIGPLGVAVFVLPHQRYTMSTIPFCAALAAGGAMGLSTNAATETPGGPPKHRPLMRIALGLCLLIVPLPWAVNRPLREGRDVPRVYRDVGVWMREHLPKGRMLARPGTYVSYYAGVPEYTFMPSASAESIVAHARLKGIRYIVLDGRLRYPLRPGLEAVFRGDPAELGRHGLRQVYSNGRSGDDKVSIVEVASDRATESAAIGQQ